MLEAFRRCMKIHYLQLEGPLGPHVWRGFEGSLRDSAVILEFKPLWRSRSHWFNEEVANHFN